MGGRELERQGLLGKRIREEKRGLTADKSKKNKTPLQRGPQTVSDRGALKKERTTEKLNGQKGVQKLMTPRNCEGGQWLAKHKTLRLLPRELGRKVPTVSRRFTKKRKYKTHANGGGVKPGTVWTWLVQRKKRGRVSPL